MLFSLFTISGNSSKTLNAKEDTPYFFTAFLTTLLPLKLNKWLENLAWSLAVEADPI